MPKGTRATKITDSHKAWNRKPTPSSYKIDTIPVKRTILIVCEGQTEKLYFEAFPVLGVRVKAIDLGGQSKLKLVESTQEIVERSEERPDDIWCVFDMDIKRGSEECADFDNSINKALQLGYQCAYSNDSFELWFYLHYNFTDNQNLRTFYYEELGKRFGLNYIKDGKRYDFCTSIYQRLLTDQNSSQEKAIANANRLFMQLQHLPYHQQNPVTKVYELVVVLNENLRK